MRQHRQSSTEGPSSRTTRNNLARRPRPASVALNTGEGTFDESVNYIAFYAQDQWTMKRMTVSGALRYDHATSCYNPTCVGGDGNEPWMPVQIGGEYAGQKRYCTPEIGWRELSRHHPALGTRL